MVVRKIGNEGARDRLASMAKLQRSLAAPRLSTVSIAEPATAGRTMAGMFKWDRLFTWSKGPPTVLRLRGTEVARLTQKIGSEQWLADLNQHLDWNDPRRRPKDCRSYETGRAGVDEWARRHAERLDREVAEIERRQHRLTR